MLQSDQNKNCKYYQYYLENANFSKLSGKGHKAKGQILKQSNGSLWNEFSGILLFCMIFTGFTIARTLTYSHYVIYLLIKLLSELNYFQIQKRFTSRI